MAEVQQTTAPAAAAGAAPQGGNRAPRPGQGQRGGNNRGPRRDQAPQEPKQFEELVINIDRVSRVVKGGRRFRFKALVVVGDGEQYVGVGMGKAKEISEAVRKGIDKATKNLQELTGKPVVEQILFTGFVMQ